MEKALNIISSQVQQLLQQDRISEAIYALEEVISWSLSQLGLTITDKFHQVDRAAALLRTALFMDPGNWAFACNLAHVLNIADNYEDAKTVIEQAIKWSAGGNYESLYNYGVILTNLSQHQKAIQTYENAIEIAQKVTMAQYNLSISYLLFGMWEKGWPYYEHRFECFPKPKAVAERFTNVLPMVKHGDDLKGKRLYIFNEQGIGDMFFFGRYLPMLKKQGVKKITLEAQQLAAPLFRDTLGVDEVIPRDDDNWPSVAKDAYDAVMSICSLGGFFNAGIKKIPNKSYVFAPNKDVKLVPAITECDKMRVGICFAGNENHVNDWRRSCPLRHFSELAKVPGIQLFSFQKQPRQNRTWKCKYVNLAAGADWSNIVDLDPYLTDFTDTAYLLDQMDLIISVDTSIPHLAGAMGKPTWVLLDYLNDWRWGLETDKSDWYPTVRLFRQAPTVRQWQPVFDDVAKALVPYQKEWQDRKATRRGSSKGSKKRARPETRPA